VGTLGPRAWGGPDDLHLSRAAASTRVRTGPVVVHPGAASGSRRWPADRFAAVARSLGASARVVVTGSAGEARLCREVVTGAGLPSTADLSGRLDLPALARLVSGARLLVCGDTGVAHLATALGTPSVLLFGPTPPSRWGPLVDLDRHHVLWHGGGPAWSPGDPHGDLPDATLLRIEVPEVLAAARRLLATPSRGALPRRRLGVVPA
jgi:ADP-heptose:LPS heptosyltransferase